jgi:hypothetical protein
LPFTPVVFGPFFPDHVGRSANGTHSIAWDQHRLQHDLDIRGRTHPNLLPRLRLKYRRFVYPFDDEHRYRLRAYLRGDPVFGVDHPGQAEARLLLDLA